MIDAVKNYVEQIVYIAIFVLLLELILPKGNTRKHIMVVVSLIVLMNIVYPIFHILKDKNMKDILINVVETASSDFKRGADTEAGDFSKYKNLIVTNDVEKRIQKDVKEKANKLNVKVDKINIFLEEDYTFKKIKIYVYPIDLIRGF